MKHICKITHAVEQGTFSTRELRQHPENEGFKIKATVLNAKRGRIHTRAPCKGFSFTWHCVAVLRQELQEEGLQHEGEAESKREEQGG